MKGLIGIIIVVALGLAIFLSLDNKSSVLPPEGVSDGSVSEEPEEGLVTGQALVDYIEIRILESFPVQVHVNVLGVLADRCTELGDIITDRKGNNFTIDVTTLRPSNIFCAQVIKPFETIVPLDVIGLKAGTYVVTINGIKETFTLDADNF
jgi:inhibitor of cysteine peptidase